MSTEKLNLVTLGDDILYLILSQLLIDSFPSLARLAQVSRACKKLADPFLYRSITLTGNHIKLGDAEWPIYSYKDYILLWRRLLDSDDDILRHVRDLRITGVPDSVPIFFATLKQVIQRLDNLLSFSWNINVAIPKEAIDQIENRWPNARLCVKNDRVGTHASYPEMDLSLLPVPQLYSLDYTIFCSDPAYSNDKEYYSEFRKLKDVLVRSNNLRILHLEVKSQYHYRGHNNSKSNLPTGPDDIGLNLPFRYGDYFPPLEELKFSVSYQMLYDLSREHCIAWKNCMDWHQLQRLDFSQGCPQAFFSEMQGCIPNLKSLRFTFYLSQPTQYHRVWACNDPAPIRDFIESIRGLQELIITNQTSNIQSLWPAIRKHRSSLQTLVLHTVPSWLPAPPVLYLDQFEELQQNFPELTQLELDIPQEVAEGKGKTKEIIMPSQSHISILSLFNRLHKLKIWFELAEAPSIFSDTYRWDVVMGSSWPPPVKRPNALEFTSGLFHQIFKNDPYASLTHLQLGLTRLSVEDRGQSFVLKWMMLVQRLEKVNALKPVDGGYTVTCSDSWDE